MSIEYKPELFDLLHDLTTIDRTVVFNKEDDKIIIKRSDVGKTIAYFLEAPLKYFDIDESIAVYDFIEFYRFIKIIDYPSIIKKENKFILYKEGSKINYVLSNIESIKTGPKKVNFNSYDFKFKLSKESLYELLKMHNNIKSKYATININNNSMSLKVYKDEEDNSFEKKFDGENVSNIDINFGIHSDLFEKIPMKRDYMVYIKNPGYMKINLLDSEMNLNIYFARRS